MQTKSLPILLTLGVLFGSAFLYMNVIVEQIAPTEIVAARLLLGALAVMTIMAVMRRSPWVNPSVLPGAALLVILDSVVPHSLIAWAELSIDSGLAVVPIKVVNR
jgi:EamA domain-containing membrane protein RarD